jgi:prepilin-type N-terminal cleavage/methylation domain-containing protein
MRKIGKLLKPNRGFTLVECVLASAIISIGATLILSMVQMGFSYIQRSRTVDTMASVAQKQILVDAFDDNKINNYMSSTTEFVNVTEDGKTYQVAYTDKIDVSVAYELYYGSGENAATDIILPDSDAQYIAVIVKDNNGNRIVYYMVSPRDPKIKALYVKKE